MGLGWMEGIEDETSGWSDAFDTDKGVAFIDLPLAMTIEFNFSALNFRLAHVRAVIHRESKIWAPENVDDIRLWSSMKVRNKGSAVLLPVNLGPLACIEYSSMMFIPAKKRIMERM